jgi:uncharacterized membrane protein
MKKMTTFVLILTATLTGLTAGLFYAYSCSVNLGLGKLSDEGYLAAMQSINREILNPVFYATFMGTLFLLPLSTWLQYNGVVSKRFLFLLAATAVYAIGVFGVTILGNVPLNEALDKFNLHSATVEEIRKQRLLFEIPWNKLNNIRTLANIAALVLVIMACLAETIYENRIAEPR